MLTISHNDIYFDRMSNSIGDKINLVKHLVPGNVLDVGAGGGDLAEYMRLAQAHKYGEREVFAIDGSKESVKRIKQNYPLVNSSELMVDELLAHFGENSFDNIVCSSILHEVYSYGGYDVNKIHHALNDFYKMLRPGGRLLIRDGVMPDNHEDDIVLNFADEQESAHFLLKYQEIAPYYGNQVNIKDYNNGSVLCNMRSAMEILYTYTWGMGSISREALEIYGVMTQKDYVESVTRAGFNQIVEARQYIQPEYITHLEHKVTITDADFGDRVDFPSSNMVIIAEK